MCQWGGHISLFYRPKSASKLQPYTDNVNPEWLKKALSTLRFGFEPRTAKGNYIVDLDLIKWSTDVTVNKYLMKGIQTASKYIPYQGATINCTNVASMSLWLNGIPNIGIHPFLLHASTTFSTAARSDLFSYYLINH